MTNHWSMLIKIHKFNRKQNWPNQSFEWTTDGKRRVVNPDYYLRLDWPYKPRRWMAGRYAIEGLDFISYPKNRRSTHQEMITMQMFAGCVTH